jgi:16S rRNA (guanine527-N7)-methyltransferase
VFHVKQSPPEGLEAYAALLHRYHGTLDLLSPTALDELPLKLEEAFFYVKPVTELLERGFDWLDVGSGAGLPAIPLAISQPHISFTLVERRRKRANFLQLVRAQLALKNVTVIQGDVKSWRSQRGFEVISAQALGSFLHLYSLTRHLHAGAVTLVSRKGPDWHGEAEALERALEPDSLKCQEFRLAGRGRLVSVTVSGGLACPPSG